MVTNYDRRAFSINIFSEAGGCALAKCLNALSLIDK